MNQNTWRLLHDNNKLLTVRVNSQLFDAFKIACEAEDISISMSIREFMIGTVLASKSGTSQEDIQNYVDDMADILYETRKGLKGGH